MRSSREGALSTGRSGPVPRDVLSLDLLALPAADRLELALLLWESLPSGSEALGMSRGHSDALRRRIRESEVDPGRSVTPDAVREAIRACLDAIDRGL